MASFYINTNKVDAVSDNIKTIGDKCDTILSSVNGYDVNNEGGFNFSGAKDAIANNLEGAKIKFNNTVSLLTAVVKVHGGIQESVNDTGDTVSSTGCGSKGCGSKGCGSRGCGGGGCSSRGSSGCSSGVPEGGMGGSTTVLPSNYQKGDFVNYYQGNYKQSYGYGTTIASAGCGPTSMAMVLTYLLGETHDPVEIANWSLKGGYHIQGEGTAWSFFGACAKAYDVECQQMAVTKDAIINNLKAGKVIIMNVGPGHFTSGGHYIVLRGITDDGKIIVADPASEKRSNQVWDIDVFLKEGKQMWVFDGGKKKETTAGETQDTDGRSKNSPLIKLGSASDDKKTDTKTDTKEDTDSTDSKSEEVDKDTGAKNIEVEKDPKSDVESGLDLETGAETITTDQSGDVDFSKVDEITIPAETNPDGTVDTFSTDTVDTTKTTLDTSDIERLINNG